ncbi:MAG: DUF5688 family protein [Eubacteriales bacterium]
MEFQEFKERLCEELKVQLGEDTTLTTTTVCKNNGIVLNGITISPPGTNIYPNIYIDDMYERCKELEDELDYTAIALDVLDCYENSLLGFQLERGFFETFASVKHNIVCKLVNYEANIEYLKEHPHKRFHDLAIIFYYLFEEKPLHHASIFLQQKHCEMWGIEVDTLYKIAIRNMRRLFVPRISTLEERIYGMLHVDSTEYEDSDTNRKKESCSYDTDQSSAMYILDNNSDVNGAVTLLSPSILKSFAKEMESDFYILPSSIHELILVPTKTSKDVEHYKSLVKSANEECVDEEDFLSNSVYYYSQKTNSVLCFQTTM